MSGGGGMLGMHVYSRNLAGHRHHVGSFNSTLTIYDEGKGKTHFILTRLSLLPVNWRAF